MARSPQILNSYIDEVFIVGWRTGDVSNYPTFPLVHKDLNFNHLRDILSNFVKLNIN